VSKVLDRADGFAKTTVGTPYYMSPEVFLSKPYSYKSDCWSLGCVLYELATLRRPFDARDISDLKKKVCRSDYGEGDIPAHYSSELRDVIKGLLSPDPKDRPKPAQLLRLPVIMSRIAVFVSQFNLTPPLCMARTKNIKVVGDNQEVTTVVVGLFQGQNAADCDIEGLITKAELIKVELKVQVRQAHEDVKEEEDGLEVDALHARWDEIHRIESQLEEEECLLQLLQLLFKWQSEGLLSGPQASLFDVSHDNLSASDEIVIIAQSTANEAVPMLMKAPPVARWKQQHVLERGGGAREVETSPHTARGSPSTRREEGPVARLEQTLQVNSSGEVVEEVKLNSPMRQPPGGNRAELEPRQKLTGFRGSSEEREGRYRELEAPSEKSSVVDPDSIPEPRGMPLRGGRDRAIDKASYQRQTSTIVEDLDQGNAWGRPQRVSSQRPPVQPWLRGDRAEQFRPVVDEPMASPGALGTLMRGFEQDTGLAQPEPVPFIVEGGSGPAPSPLKALLKQHFGGNRTSPSPSGRGSHQLYHGATSPSPRQSPRKQGGRLSEWLPRGGGEMFE